MARHDAPTGEEIAARLDCIERHKAEIEAAGGPDDEWRRLEAERIELARAVAAGSACGGRGRRKGKRR